MEQQWYIDALDDRSGLAFASYRMSDLIGAAKDWPDLSAMAWFIAAPDFQPEPVSSRAIGFAAAQRGLQLGLSLNGETEVSFPSLEALADYVRRLFISGGGGDGAAGVDPALGGPPEGGGEPEGEFEGEFEMASSSSRTYGRPLSMFAEELTQKSRQLGPTETAIALHPLQGLSVSGPYSDIAPWRVAVPLIAREIDRRGRQIAMFDHGALLSLARSEQALLAIAGAFGVSDFVDRRFSRTWPWHEMNEADILDLLALLPISRRLGHPASPREDWQSVKDLFYSVLGNPGLLILPPHRPQLTAIFLFAAAAMVRTGLRLDFFPPDHFAMQRVTHAFMEQVFDWLRPQLPKYALSVGLEQTIVASSRPG
ncbi:MAG: hypothetical protein ACK47C_00610 [Paracoccaceae bacterium]